MGIDLLSPAFRKLLKLGGLRCRRLIRPISPRDGVDTRNAPGWRAFSGVRKPAFILQPSINNEFPKPLLVTELILLVGIIVVFLLAVFPRASFAATEALQIVIPSRLPLLPKTLDTLRRKLNHDLKHKVSLSFRQISTAFTPDDVSSGTLILAEEGFIPDPAKFDLRKTNWRITFVWVLAVKEDMLSNIASSCPGDLDSFMGQLAELKKIHPESFPWFESLNSPNTMLRLERAMSPNGDNRSTFVSVHEAASGTFKNAVKVLQKALDEKLLNPLSLEADETLSCEVYEAGDSVFSSMWMFEDFLASGPRLLVAFKNTLFFPFPGPDGKTSLPKIKFHLWVPSKILEIASDNIKLSSTAEAKEIGECDFAQETAWIKENFSMLYDELLRGEP